MSSSVGTDKNGPNDYRRAIKNIMTPIGGAGDDDGGG
eukprot:CAMPEP_0181083684 /NCGR_PEP_ID=MMETSP1071-20121207/4292_1 /TAXON_ID=35127 /ORGANISM="Thalassiosira sp., Strain NH16" /LENGTH=36 /DNA_ID= /DNA_START= /DNA_END= /DNA_ORIENTATION=